MTSDIGPLDHLIKMLGGLPGLGNRSARRIALHLLSNRDMTMTPLANAITRAADEIKGCHTCGNLDTVQPCRICTNEKRDAGVICVIAQVSDLWAVERTGSYRGRYHVLGGILSAIDGIGPQDLRIDGLTRRVRAGGITEVILALSATVDGQSTAHYIADRLHNIGTDTNTGINANAGDNDGDNGAGVKITRLAHGVPVGGELDYLDDGTITTALKARKSA